MPTAHAENADADTIIVADPDVVVRTNLAEFLRECGYRVIEAATVAECVALIGSDKVRVDVVLADIATPGDSNGFGLASWIRRERPDIDVVLVGSAESTAGAAKDLCEDKPALQKPYDRELVLSQIRQMVARRKG